MEAGGEVEGGDNHRTTVSNSVNNADKHSQNGVTDTSSDVPNKEHVPAKSAGTPEGVTNLAFTIDFGEESKTPLEGRSLGDLMPPKMRKSLRERKEKQMEKASANTSLSSSKEKITPEKHKTVTDKSKPKSTEKIAVSLHFSCSIFLLKQNMSGCKKVHSKLLLLSLTNILNVNYLALFQTRKIFNAKHEIVSPNVACLLHAFY